MKDPRTLPIADLIVAPESYKNADTALLFSICHGCGSSQSKFDLVPDTLYGLDISPACFPHDWAYKFGKTKQDKQQADFDFLRNMLTLINNDTGFIGIMLRIPRRRRALKYYEAVNRFGDKAFWAGKTQVR